MVALLDPFIVVGLESGTWRNCLLLFVMPRYQLDVKVNRLINASNLVDSGCFRAGTGFNGFPNGVYCD